VTEPEYRELLFGDTDKALEGYELTEEERDALKGMERETFDEVAEELEERISKAGLGSVIGDPGVRDPINRLFVGKAFKSQL
jgi:hypothetical protein